MTSAGFPDYVTGPEVAAMFRVDTRTVSRWAREGKLSPVRTPGGHLRFLRADVLQLTREELEATVTAQAAEFHRLRDQIADAKADHRAAQGLHRIAQAEADELRELLTEVLSAFTGAGVPGLGYTASAADGDFDRWVTKAGIEARS